MCVTNSIDISRSRLSEFSKPMMAARTDTSKADVTSSHTRRAGSWISARHTLTLPAAQLLRVPVAKHPGAQADAIEYPVRMMTCLLVPHLPMQTLPW